MSLLESHHHDQCRTAEDVRDAARAVLEKRRRNYAKTKKILAAPPAPTQVFRCQPPIFEITNRHPLMELVLAAADMRIEERTPPSLREIQRSLCAAWNINHNDLLSIRHAVAVTEPRQVGYLLSRLLTGASYPAIGRMYRRDHSTIIHGIAKFKWLEDILRAKDYGRMTLAAVVSDCKKLIDLKKSGQLDGSHTNDQA